MTDKTHKPNKLSDVLGKIESLAKTAPIDLTEIIAARQEMAKDFTIADIHRMQDGWKGFVAEPSHIPQIPYALAAYETAEGPKEKYNAQDHLCRLADRESEGLGMHLHSGDKTYFAGCTRDEESRIPFLVVLDDSKKKITHDESPIPSIDEFPGPFIIGHVHPTGLDEEFVSKFYVTPSEKYYKKPSKQ